MNGGPFIHLSIPPSIHSFTPTHFFICPFTHPIVHPSIHQSTHLSISSSNHPFIHSSIHSIHPFIHHPSICPTIHILIHSIFHPSFHSSIHVLIHAFVYISIWSSIYPAIYLFVNPSIHLSIHTSIHLCIYSYKQRLRCQKRYCLPKQTCSLNISNLLKVHTTKRRARSKQSHHFYPLLQYTQACVDSLTSRNQDLKRLKRLIWMMMYSGLGMMVYSTSMWHGVCWSCQWSLPLQRTNYRPL